MSMRIHQSTHSIDCHDNLSDPEFEPTDEQLFELAAEVRESVVHRAKVADDIHQKKFDRLMIEARLWRPTTPFMEAHQRHPSIAGSSASCLLSMPHCLPSS